MSSFPNIRESIADGLKENFGNLYTLAIQFKTTPKRQALDKTMKNSISTMLAIMAFLIQGLGAQDLHIHFDASTDEVYFMKDGKTIPHPQVKRGQQIWVHVMNYNNYLYEVELEVEEKKNIVATKTGDGKQPTSSTGTNPLMGMLFGGGGMGLPGIPNLSGLSSGFGFADKSQQDKVQQRITILDQQVKALQSQVNSTIRSLDLTEKNMASLMDQVRLEQFAHDEIYRVRYDRFLHPDKIKFMASEYAEVLFGETDPDKLTLSLLKNRKLSRTEMATDYTLYLQQIAKLDSFHLEMKSILHELNGIQTNDEEFKDYLSAVKDNEQKIASRVEQMHAKKKVFEQALIEFDEIGTDKLTAARTAYAVLMENTFSKSYHQEATGESMDFKVTLVSVDTAKSNRLPDRKLTPITVRVVGGIRVTTSVGLGFGQYFERPNTWFIRDSTVNASPNDAFVPLLSSYVHFYYPSGKNLSWGGSFGVGLPLTGTEGFQSLTFFLGPSAVIGQNSRVIITGGLMGGRVNVPAQGYAKGDVFSGDPGLFKTESRYKLGYFLSASFNLSGN